VGVAFIVVPFATEMPTKTQAADTMTGDFRPLYRQRLQYRQNINMLEAMADQLGQMPPEQRQELGSPSLATAEGVSRLSEAVDTFKLFVKGLELTAPDFRLADQVPIKPLPATSVHYIFLLTGVMLAGMGAAGLLFEQAARPMLRLSVLMGPMLIATTLLWQFPAKTQAVDNLTGGFRLFMTNPVADKVRADMDALKAMTDELAQAPVPASLAASAPALGEGVSRLGAIVPAFEKLTRAIEGNVGNFHLADSLPTERRTTTTMTWLFVYPALLLLASGGTALLIPSLRGRRLSPQSRSDLRDSRISLGAVSAATPTASVRSGDGPGGRLAHAHQHDGADKERCAWTL
jgi:hypothetical protein